LSWTSLVAAVAVVVDEDRVLLVRQRRPTGTRWEFPGGYLEAGETLEQAAAREALEEAGVAVEIGELICTMVWEREAQRRRNLIAYFAATPAAAGAGLSPQLEEGVEDARYVDFSAIDRAEVHPMELPILERWPERGYHLHLDIREDGGGAVSYELRQPAS
jgi:8-oxo-dGTP diphosphatase